MRLDQVVGQDGLWYHVISLIATEVILLSMGYLWCVASTIYTIQTIRHHKNFIHAPIKTYLDYSVFD